MHPQYAGSVGTEAVLTVIVKGRLDIAIQRFIIPGRHGRRGIMEKYYIQVCDEQKGQNFGGGTPYTPKSLAELVYIIFSWMRSWRIRERSHIRREKQ
jgi:hypothetical protein